MRWVSGFKDCFLGKEEGFLEFYIGLQLGTVSIPVCGRVPKITETGGVTLLPRCSIEYGSHGLRIQTTRIPLHAKDPALLLVYLRIISLFGSPYVVSDGPLAVTIYSNSSSF